MLQAQIVTWICTFCKVRENKNVQASIVGTFTLTQIDATNYDAKVRTYPAISFLPSVAEEVTFCACPEHEDSVVNGQLGKFPIGLQAIGQAVALEVPAVTTEPDGEEPEEPEDDDQDDDDQEEEGDAPAAPVVEPVGTKKIPTPEPLREAIAAAAAAKKSAVNNPRPDQADPDALKPVGDGGPQWFGEGYKPSTDAPKPEEREAMRRWFEDLEEMDRLRLTLKAWPKRGVVPAKIIEAYRWTEEFSQRFHKPTTV